MAVQLGWRARAPCTSTTACGPSPPRTPTTAVRCARAWRSSWTSSTPAGPTTRRATSRPGRATSATPPRPARRPAALVAAGHTATDQAETVLYRLATSPGAPGAAGHAAAVGAPRAPAAVADPRRRPRQWCRVAGAGLARGRHERLGSFRARARARAPRPGAARPSTRGPTRTSCAPPSCCATRPRCSTSSWRRRSPAATGSPSPTSPRCRARWRAWSCGAWPRTRPARRARGRRPGSTTCSRSGDGALDVGDGARGVVAAGVLRFEATPPLGARSRTPADA